MNYWNDVNLFLSLDEMARNNDVTSASAFIYQDFAKTICIITPLHYKYNDNSFNATLSRSTPSFNSSSETVKGG